MNYPSHVLPKPSPVTSSSAPTFLTNLQINSAGYTAPGTIDVNASNITPYLIPNILNSQAPHHPIAEFLYQLTKMLTDDNREIIEWSGGGGCGRIHVHDPHRLAEQVLHKYFRHSKYASFQRQLNYFGFRKIAGKGKMSPCSYVNDSATEDLGSLLFIKRKTNGSTTKKSPGQTTNNSRHVQTSTKATSCDNNSVTSLQIMSGKKRQWIDSSQTSDTTTNHVMIPITTLSMDATVASPSLILSNSSILHFDKPQNPILPQNDNYTNIDNQFNPIQPQQQQLAPIQIAHQDHSGNNQFSEQLHFPSEKSIAAMVARQKADNTANSTSVNFQQQSSNVTTAQDIIPNTSFPATEAMNAENATNANQRVDLFDTDSNDSLISLLDYGNASNHTSSTMPPPLTKSNTNTGIMSCLPSSNTLFPDSCTSLSKLLPSTNAADNEGQMTSLASNQLLNYTTMLSPNSSLVDLAVVPKNQIESTSEQVLMKDNSDFSGGGIIG